MRDNDVQLPHMLADLIARDLRIRPSAGTPLNPGHPIIVALPDTRSLKKTDPTPKKSNSDESAELRPSSRPQRGRIAHNHNGDTLPYFMTTYSYTADIEQRFKLRPQHREWLQSLSTTNVLSGPTDASTGILIFDSPSTEAVLQLLDRDPFHAGGVIHTRQTVEWTPMTGRLIDNL